MPPTFLAIAILLGAAAGAFAQPLDCSWTKEAYSKKGSPLAVDKPGTSQPMTPYWADSKGAAKEVFEKLQLASGQIAVELEFAACSGGALAYTPSMHPPAGKVQICDELFGLVRDKDQLASVLGHELAHVELLHSDTLHELHEKLLLKVHDSFKGKELSDEKKGVVIEKVYCATLQKASRDAERAADAKGLELMKKAGYDTAAAAETWRSQRDARWVAGMADTGYSHPAASERAANAQRRHDDLRNFQRQEPKRAP